MHLVVDGIFLNIKFIFASNTNSVLVSFLRSFPLAQVAFSEPLYLSRFTCCQQYDIENTSNEKSTEIDNMAE